METHWRHKNGKVSDILLSSALLDPAHPYEDVIFIAMDVTELHRSERALKEYSERLKRSNEDLERFAFISSDDLQEPLRTMVTFTQLLEKRYRGQLDPDADEFLHYIVSAGKRMQHLITDLLEFSRVNTQGGDFRPTDATAVVEDVLASIHSIAEENGATITRDRSRVIADANQVR
ncbi:MAG: histidine kinase dimerization/phospho-acceptor domain-containing protein [Methanomicrobiales archaeon]|nr:histidine kinase dimerization/phospho-acceptor domain-containing protein [Methanomicrobiales archaeon]